MLVTTCSLHAVHDEMQGCWGIPTGNKESCVPECASNWSFSLAAAAASVPVFSSRRRGCLLSLCPSCPEPSADGSTSCCTALLSAGLVSATPSSLWPAPGGVAMAGPLLLDGSWLLGMKKLCSFCVCLSVRTSDSGRYPVPTLGFCGAAAADPARADIAWEQLHLRSGLQSLSLQHLVCRLAVQDARHDWTVKTSLGSHEGEAYCSCPLWRCCRASQSA